jgi:hypothetical protein
MWYRKNHLVSMWCRNFPLRAFSDTRTEIISNRVIVLAQNIFFSNNSQVNFILINALELFKMTLLVQSF